MVERLKEAIEKARAQRAQLAGTQAGVQPPAGSTGSNEAAAGPAPVPGRRDDGAQRGIDWSGLEAVTLATGRLQRSRVVTLDRSDPAHTAFDVLRSRILKAFHDNGWTRLAITSPSKGCGKTFVSTNLALSFARQPDLRTLLVDMDLRAPQIAPTLGLRERRSIRDFLTGATPPESHLRRLGDNLALALNTERVRDAAELILERRTAGILSQTIAALAPDMVIYDLPPMLVNDDAFAFLPHVDAVLLAAAAGETRARQIEACEQLLEGHAAFLGVLLNKVEEGGEDTYGYGYGYG
jgi:Mrp family chromosome partitioning ATPase